MVTPIDIPETIFDVREWFWETYSYVGAYDSPQPSSPPKPRDDSISASMVGKSVEVNDVKIFKRESVWMVDENKSAARAITEDVIRAIGLVDWDFQTRDKIISAINDRLTSMLNHAAKKKK